METTRERSLPEEIGAEGKTQEEALARFSRILTALRRDCPWDRAQTHESLRICMLEEAYEVCEAIDRQDESNLREELGDVLLQVLFHSQLAMEKGLFDLREVINGACEKLIRRHPHVFSKESAESVDKALERWENVKRAENGERSYADRLRSVPSALPSLMRSYKIQAKAAEVGFDWDDVSGPFRKMEEEMAELLDAFRKNDEEGIEAEIGDLLFSVVNAARFLRVNPEQALNATSDRFVKRFALMEEEASAQGQTLKEMTLCEMDALWEEAKRRMKTRESDIK